MAAPINTNRYRLILLLYLTFICLSLLSVPASLLESNLYVIKTLSYQEDLIKKQLDRSGSFFGGYDTTFIRDQRSLQNYIYLQIAIQRSYRFLDSIDRSLLGSLRLHGTSIDKEFSKRKRFTALLKRDSLAQKIQDDLFMLSKEIDRYDPKLGSSFARWLPVTPVIVTSNQKKVSWVNYFLLDKPTSVGYMQFKRIKLLLLQIQSDVVERKDSVITASLLARQVSLDSQLLQNKVTATSVNSARAAVEKMTEASTLNDIQLDILRGIRLDRFYTGISLPLLADLPAIDLTSVEVEFSPQVKVLRSANRIDVLFSTPGQYMLWVYLRGQGQRKILLTRSVTAQRLPDPAIQLLTDDAGRNIISAADLFRINSLTTTLPVSGVPSVALRINGFRATVLGAKDQQPAVYNYGQVFQEGTKQLFSKLKKGDLLLLDNITVAVGDGSTRSIKPVLYKITD